MTRRIRGTRVRFLWGSFSAKRKKRHNAKKSDREKPLLMRYQKRRFGIEINGSAAYRGLYHTVMLSRRPLIWVLLRSRPA
jgi:hypothetical protein